MRTPQNPILWLVVILAAVVVILVGLVVYSQRQEQLRTEAIRREVEQESYREGELGHRPGEVPGSAGR
jgi:uncharacterized iron-regulated membrane protein